MQLSTSFAQVDNQQEPEAQQDQAITVSLLNDKMKDLVETYYEYYNDEKTIALKIDELCGDDEKIRSLITKKFMSWIGSKKSVVNRINELYRRHPDISISALNGVVTKSNLQKGDPDFDYVQSLISTIQNERNTRVLKSLEESLKRNDPRPLSIFDNVIVEESSKGESVLSEEKYSLRYTNDWDGTYKDREYKVVRYSGGTTKVFDFENNWMQFKTEYVKNEFTGENTSNPTNGFKYVNSSIKPILIAAQKRIPNGYTLYVNGNKISMKTPMGITYETNRESVTSEIWRDNWNSPTLFRSELNYYFNNNENETVVKGPGGDVLLDMTSTQFKDVAGNKIHGGYYDEKGMRMYYALGALEYTPLCLVTLQFCLQPCLIDGEVRLLYSLPSDIISNINSDENKIEISYQNGDYLKMSKLKSGIVYDCSMHRPNGIWKVKVDDAGNIISDFEYTQGVYKGLIYKGNFLYDQYAQCLACHDMINRDMMKDRGYDPKLYEPSKDRWLTVRPDGKIQDYIDEERERREQVGRAETAKKIQNERSAFSRKYGQNVQNSLDNMKIPVGMPISALTEYRDKTGSQIFKCAVYDDHGNSKRYEVNALIIIWGRYASVWTSGGKVSSVHYYEY